MRLLGCLFVLAGGALAQSGRCASAARFDLSGPSWNGWSPDASNARFQAASAAQIPADQVSQLKLKWAYGFAGAKAVLGAPVIAGGRVFLGVDTGEVYSLEAATGCLFWSFRADAGVRSAVTVERVGERYAAYFGDLKANAYALDAATGELLWKVHVDDHPRALITAAPKAFEGRVYVPVASGEEGAGVNPNYACCTFRGSVVALDAATGRRIWKTFTIAEAPKPAGQNSNGTARWAPAGGGVWNSPTIDARRRALYIGTGDAYTEPAPKTTDAIVALNLDDGKILWSAQDTENDAWLAGCNGARASENCPKALGPDHDFGSSPILKTLGGGRTILIAGQKSGNVWAHDPDRKGAVIWRTALVNNTAEFGGKIVWGGAADDQNAYFGLGPGGIAAVQLRDGERKWFTALAPAPAVASHPGQDGALSAIPGVVFSGGFDGVLRALAADTGRVLWEYDTVRDFPTVNGAPARGGSLSVAGPTVAGGMVFAGSGYVGVRNGMPGNALLAFSLR
ncbi:MAG TPA: PQQ-binding-like beta-propeller repeat protein [Bryobacteraceae bacterium]|nr:PQQ-binding-like beta-propeller repeat protein [Bryobacteraceae bacterium]